MLVKFWGVRGSVPVPGPSTVKYGGNTTCLQVSLGERIILFDAGSGIRVLGSQLSGRTGVRINLFLSHVHWDHIQGFPFFVPAMSKGNSIDIYGTEKTDLSLGEILSGQMEGPHFPVSLAQMGGRITFHGLKEGQTITIRDKGKVVGTVRNARLNHPNGVVGYRLTEKQTGQSMVFTGDTEHYAEGLDRNLVDLARDADILIYDGQYTKTEYEGGKGVPSHKTWGHSTWRKGVEVAEEARVKRLIITHHDPMHNDTFLDRLSQKAAKLVKSRKRGTKFPSRIDWAREGMTVRLG